MHHLLHLYCISMSTFEMDALCIAFRFYISSCAFEMNASRVAFLYCISSCAFEMKASLHWSWNKQYGEIALGITLSTSTHLILLPNHSISSFFLRKVSLTLSGAKLIKRTPPPLGRFPITMFPDQEPGGRGSPSKNLY